MKKTLLSATLAMTLGLSTSLMATETDRYVYLGVGQADILETATPMYKFGFGVDKIFSNDVVAGFESSFSYSSIGSEDQTAVSFSEDTNFIGVDIQANLGYQVVSNVNVFGSIGYMVQTIGSETSATGLGFGGGVSYKPFNSFSVAAEYKTFDMESSDSLIQYDLSVAEIQLRYVF